MIRNAQVSASSSGGIGFLGALTLLFITLKLLGITAVATWSWWWVLSPLWIGFALGLLFIGIFLGVCWYLDNK